MERENKRTMYKTKKQQLVRFENKEFGSVRVVVENGKPWICIGDAAGCTHLTYGEAESSIKEDGKKDFYIIDFNGKPLKIPAANKQGVIDLAIAYPSAVTNFYQWLLDDVYPEFELDDNTTNKKKLQYADALLVAGKPMMIGEFLKILNKNGFKMNMSDFLTWLRENDFTSECKEIFNLPTYGASTKNYMTVTTKKKDNTDGSSVLTQTPMILPAGQMEIIDLLLESEGKEDD